MADIARIKGNIAKMIAQNAPEADIDAYVSSEGVTLDELRKPSAPAPDKYQQAALEERDALKAKGIDTGAGLTRRLMQGATLNFGDEIMAGLSTPLEMVKRGTFDPREGYNYAKAREDLIMDDARKNTGVLGTAAEIGGGVGTGAAALGAGLTFARGLAPNAGLLGRSLASAGDSAAFGALSGAGDGGSIGERFNNSLLGGAAGGAVGAAAPAVTSLIGQAASPIISNIRARLNPQGYAQSQVARAIQESGAAPNDLSLRMVQAANEGQGVFTLADAMGNSGQRMLSTVARAPGEGRTAVVNALEGRQADQGRRVAAALSEGFDAPQTATQRRTAMEAARDATADLEYGAARTNARPVDVSNVLARIDQEVAPYGVPHDVTSPDSITAALVGIRRQLANDRGSANDFNLVQRVRQEVADMAQTARQSGQGNRARLLGQVARELDTSLEASSAGYQQANRNFAQASRDIEAIDAGRAAAMRGRPEDTVPAFQRLTQEGQRAFRSGYADPLIEQAQGAAYGVNKARPLTSDAFAYEAQAMAPGNAMMQRRLARENTMFETRNQALGGSRTADNLADAEAMGVNPTLVGQVLSGNWSGALRTALASGQNALTGNTAQVRQAVADILLQRGSSMSPAALQRMVDETTRRIQQLQLITRSMGRAAAGGLAVTPSATGQR
jgi:hypothetical protein